MIDVTLILAIAAQACHELVPTDYIIPLIKALCDNFVTDRSREEAIAIGLNTIREICARSPQILSGNELPEELIHDLIEYKSAREKSINMAARSLLTLCRTINPNLLKRRDRGKFAQTDGEVQSTYGATYTSEGVDGIELLEQMEEGEDENDEHDTNKGWEAWEQDSDGNSNEDSGSDEWIDISSGDDPIQDSDFDSDEEEKKENILKLAGEVKENNNMLLEDAGTPSSSIITEPKIRLDALRILTPQDFELIKKAKLKKEVENKLGDKGQNRKRKLEKIQENNSDFVDPSVIETIQKKRKRELEERLASVNEGREGREKYGYKKNKGGGSTNKEKLKLKPFVLQKQKREIREKNKMSFKDRQKKKQKKNKY